MNWQLRLNRVTLFSIQLSSLLWAALVLICLLQQVCFPRAIYISKITQNIQNIQSLGKGDTFCFFFSVFVCETRSLWFTCISYVSVLNPSFSFLVLPIYPTTVLVLCINYILNVFEFLCGIYANFNFLPATEYL